MSGLLAVIGYLGAGLVLFAGLIRQQPKLAGISLAIALVGACLHGVFLWQVMAVEQGWNVNFFNSLSLVSWLIVIGLLGTAWRWPVREIGIVAYPGAALWILLQLLSEPAPVLLSRLTAIVEIHVFSSLLAYAMLSIAALNALTILCQDRILNHRAPPRLIGVLPPLTTMERVLFQLILAGWLALTTSLVTGFIFIDNLMAQNLAHKTLLSVTAWVVFGLLLAGRWQLGWRGRTAIRLTLLGMAILLLAYFGSKLVLEIVLDRTWVQPA